MGRSHHLKTCRVVDQTGRTSCIDERTVPRSGVPLHSTQTQSLFRLKVYDCRQRGERRDRRSQPKPR
ncbi:unnamed protein product [Soboliphyme baturini]|uniref:ZP domain-containing protein n=1 Tax=Soboliphyme baturini TaxID=241478 RepID=A0A183J9C4_9BILA|nr:unnamed protein product [Soboliphyme baturini]